MYVGMLGYIISNPRIQNEPLAKLKFVSSVIHVYIQNLLNDLRRENFVLNKNCSD